MADVVVGTDSDTYTPDPADVGANLYCKVTATNSVGSASANSNTVGPVTSPVATSTTFDPANTAANMTLSDGNLTVTNTDGVRAGTRSIATGSGKTYFEILMTTVGNTGASVFGIANATLPLSGTFPGSDLDGCGAAFSGNIYSGGSEIAHFNLFPVNGDRVCVAMDFTAEKWWARKNGDPWHGFDVDGDPTNSATGVSFAATNDGPYYIYLALKDAGDVCTVNFGATAYAHPVPTGYGNLGA